MGLIKTKLHSILDYIIGLFFITYPFLIGFTKEGKEAWIMLGAGAIIIIYSLFTDYEGGIKKIIPLQAHLAFDGFIGLFIAFLPWMFGFSHNAAIIHLICGLFLAFASILTIVPEEKRRIIRKPMLHHLHHPIRRLVTGRRKRHIPNH